MVVQCQKMLFLQFLTMIALHIVITVNIIIMIIILTSCTVSFFAPVHCTQLFAGAHSGFRKKMGLVVYWVTDGDNRC